MIFAFIFLTSLVASALSSMSGGGSSVIAIPIFLSLGIPFPMATMMQKVSAVFWVLPVAYNYLHGRKIKWFFLSVFTIVGLIGVYFGTLIVLTIDQRTLEIIVGFLIVVLVAYIYLKKDLGTQEYVPKVSNLKNFLTYLGAFPVGVYEGVLGSGNGILVGALTLWGKGFDLFAALGYYFAAAFLWVVLAAGLLVYAGYWDSTLVFPAVLGSVVGGYLGSKFARLKGSGFIKTVFIAVGAFLGLKLILGF